MLNAIQFGACRGHYGCQSLLGSLQPFALATICFAQSCLAKEGWQTWWSLSFGRCLKEVLMVPGLSATFLGFQLSMRERVKSNGCSNTDDWFVQIRRLSSIRSQSQPDRVADGFGVEILSNLKRRLEVRACLLTLRFCNKS
ncbi:hypothetical protein C4D60_Mb06t28350 [Musa balbisiana]|uniref:Uncharacterized protein n=1 Tax=Musa balbisiana TaxID=52838 RepID=A0A4V4H4A1_MUSBA|nr:hypothetical protein C4D60_Mb06t28350 [Musa balbisiana]